MQYKSYYTSSWIIIWRAALVPHTSALFFRLNKRLLSQQISHLSFFFNNVLNTSPFLSLSPSFSRNYTFQFFYSILLFHYYFIIITLEIFWFTLLLPFLFSALL